MVKALHKAGIEVRTAIVTNESKFKKVTWLTQSPLGIARCCGFWIGEKTKRIKKAGEGPFCWRRRQGPVRSRYPRQTRVTGVSEAGSIRTSIAIQRGGEVGHLSIGLAVIESLSPRDGGSGCSWEQTFEAVLIVSSFPGPLRRCIQSHKRGRRRVPIPDIIPGHRQPGKHSSRPMRQPDFLLVLSFRNRQVSLVKLEDLSSFVPDTAASLAFSGAAQICYRQLCRKHGARIGCILNGGVILAIRRSAG